MEQIETIRNQKLQQNAIGIDKFFMNFITIHEKYFTNQ
jgi:hypothetical protein